MAEFKVTPSFLRERATGFRTNDTTFLNLMETIRKEMNSMKGMYWEGMASDTFIQRFEALANKFPTYSRAMQEYAKYLDKAATDYGSTETTVNQEAGTLKS